MSGMALLNDSSSSEDENDDSFKINEDYATRYLSPTYGVRKTICYVERR